MRIEVIFRLDGGTGQPEGLIAGQAGGRDAPRCSRPVARERIGALREYHSVGRWSGRELTGGFRGPILQRSKPAGTSSAKYGDAHDYFGPPGLLRYRCIVPRRAG